MRAARMRSNIRRYWRSPFPQLGGAEFDGLLDRIVAPTGEPFSLGERQRIQLIRAVVSMPKVLLLDEALSGIEEELERAIVAKLIADSSISILVHVGHRRSVQALFEHRIELKVGPPVAP